VPGAQLERQRLAAVPARVELLAGGKGDANVVDLHVVAGLGFRAGALPDVGDLQVSRRGAAREVDLGLADAHLRAFPCRVLVTFLDTPYAAIGARAGIPSQ
jgi:hypothetical protein